VELRAVAREPGHRSKIAVSSNEPAVDPVGACVGPKGSRVRNVVTELRGEKIDVVPWSADPATFVANALQPAKVKEARVDPETQTALVIVPDYQLSLAIGKEGQNARLAARLTGWRIDIKSETQFADEQRGPKVAPAEASGAEVAPSDAAPDGGAGSDAIPAPEPEGSDTVVAAVAEGTNGDEPAETIVAEEKADA
ncbi:MAG: transcription termination/antitermination protein NusA, partial [Actinomycetota bacterium]